MNTNLIFRQLFDYETWTYTYLLADATTKEAVLIDTVKEQVSRDLRILAELGLKLKFVLETHVHADHITGASDLREKTGARVGVSAAAGISCADLPLKENDTIPFGEFRLKVLATTGHTNTCLSYYMDGMVFTGDTLFIRDVGRTDFQQGSNEKMYENISQKLFSLPEATKVYPGHDYKGELHSTIAEEKAHNIKLGGGKSLKEFSKLMQEMKLGPPKKIHIAVPANLQCGKIS